MKFNSRILILPGLGNSGEGHWQTIWEKEHNFTRVNQRDWNTPVCADWIEKLDQVVMQGTPSTTILVGHSLACTTVAFWAAQYQRVIKGALLVAPSDTEANTYPVGTSGFTPMPTQRLPFPSIVVTSSNDYYVRLERAEELARYWGGKFVNIGPAGHINVAAGFGNWHDGLALLHQLDQAQ